MNLYLFTFLFAFTSWATNDECWAVLFTHLRRIKERKKFASSTFWLCYFHSLSLRAYLGWKFLAKMLNETLAGGVWGWCLWGFKLDPLRTFLLWLNEGLIKGSLERRDHNLEKYVWGLYISEVIFQIFSVFSDKFHFKSCIPRLKFLKSTLWHHFQTHLIALRTTPTLSYRKQAQPDYFGISNDGTTSLRGISARKSWIMIEPSRVSARSACVCVRLPGERSEESLIKFFRRCYGRL